MDCHFIVRENTRNQTIFAKKVFFFQCGTSITGYIRERSQESAKRGVTVQPQVLVLGESIKKIEQYFVIVNDTIYEMDSLVKAIDICYKAVFIFNVDYPVQAYDPWLFIQRGLCSMETPYDNIVPRVRYLIARIAK